MKAFRIHITTWTSSFRYPNLISGFQPTLDVPPLSTVLGLINAASGRYNSFGKLIIGYFFKYGTKTVDLETIYQIELKSAKTSNYPSNNVNANVIKREVLFDTNLYLYLLDKQLADYFINPFYQLLLGRSGDLATVHEIAEVDLQENTSTENLCGQIIPFNGYHLPGEIQALPKYFTNTVPRNNIGTEPFSIISFDKQVKAAGLKTFTDQIKDTIIDIFFHALNFNL